MNQIVPILLIGVGGFLIGGVVSVRKRSVPAAVLLVADRVVRFGLRR